MGHTALSAALVALASRAYQENGETVPGPSNSFAVPRRDVALGPGRVAALETHGGTVAAALRATLQADGQLAMLPRCPASLKVCLRVDGRAWACRLCGRPYEEVPAVGGGNDAPPQCVLCGGLVGPATPEFIISPPCM